LRTLTDGDLDALGAALGALTALPRPLHSPAG
ncbi:MAG TPA: MarR family transcriptional regulator, partial [Streptomyces sp.]|nr:MarR family transcriptional regulator [Streptomyces sp.]